MPGCVEMAGYLQFRLRTMIAVITCVACALAVGKLICEKRQRARETPSVRKSFTQHSGCHHGSTCEICRERESGRRDAGATPASDKLTTRRVDNR